MRECMGEPHVGERRHTGEQQGGEQPGHRHVGNFSGSSDINTSLADLNVSRRAPSPIRNARCLSPLWKRVKRGKRHSYMKIFARGLFDGHRSVIRRYGVLRILPRYWLSRKTTPPWYKP